MAETTVLGMDGLDPAMLEHTPSLTGPSFKVYKQDPLIPLTYPSWTSIMTGVNPGKHGLIDFFLYQREDGKWRARVAWSHDLGYPRITEILHMPPLRGRKHFAVVNPIPSYPLPPIRPEEGLVASFDFFTPEIASNDPDTLTKYYDVEAYAEAKERIFTSKSCGEALKGFREIARLHHEAVKEMAEDYDVVWVNMPIPDNFLHICEEVLIKPSHRAQLSQLLAELDSIAKTASKLSQNLVVVSDHGFGAYRGVAVLNSILYRHGYAVEARDSHGDSVDLEGSLLPQERIVTVDSRLVNLARRLSRGPLRPVLHSSYQLARKLLRVFGKDLVYQRRAGIDIARSKAFAPVWSNTDTARYTVLLNDPNVSGEVARLLEGYGLYSKPASQVLWGPYTPRDMVVVYGRERHPTAGTIYNPPVVDKPIAQHRKYGIIAAKLESIEPPEAEILPGYIVAPLVLCTLGAPLDKYMDGYQLLRETCRGTGTANYRAKWLILRASWRALKTMPRTPRTREAKAAE